MPLSLVKLADVGGRAVFAILLLMMLDAPEAGQLGIVMTIVALGVFALNYERQHDVLRVNAGQGDAVLSAASRDAGRLWSALALAVVPATMLTVAIALKVPSWVVPISAAIIVVADHVGNAAYNLALIHCRLSPVVWISAVRNVLLAVITANSLRLGLRPDFVSAMELWGAVSAVAVVAMVAVALWATRNARGTQEHLSIRAQLARSRHHFAIGLLAVLAVQGDRMLVSALLPLDQVGQYFRHAMIVLLVYQLFTILVLNRALPTVYAAVRERDEATARRALITAFGIAVVGVTLGTLIAFVVVTSVTALHVMWWNMIGSLAIVLLVGAVMRIAADLSGVYLNAHHAERAILLHQALGVVVAVVLTLALVAPLGILGPALGMVAGAATTLALNILQVSRARAAASEPRA